MREAQADAASFLVDLDDANLELVATLHHVVDGLGSLAGLDVRDVEEPVRALGELDERSECRGLDDSPLEGIANLDLLGHPADLLDAGVAELAVRCVYQHGAVVVDVDLG